MKVWVFILLVLLTPTAAFSAGASDILGMWNTPGGDSRLELLKCGEKLCGKIVWLKVPQYIDSVDGPIGKTKVDRKNPDPAVRSRPIVGLQVVRGLIARSGNRWDNGIC